MCKCDDNKQEAIYEHDELLQAAWDNASHLGPWSDEVLALDEAIARNLSGYTVDTTGDIQ